MKNIYFITLFLLLNILVNAQTIPYEKLDSISAEISKLQSEVNGKLYNFGDSEVELSFPEENFKVYYHNQLATTAIYKKQGGKELLEVTENIDFSKATGIVNSIRDSNILMISIYFPSGYLRTQFFENGIVVNTSNGDHLDFFKMKNLRGKNLSNYLFGLITSMQIAKGLITETEINNQKKDFNNNLSKSEAEQFILKYPTSIYNLYLKNRIKQLEEEEIDKIKKGEEAFMKYVYSKHYDIGLTLKEAKIKFPDFFRKYWSPKFSDQKHFDRMYTSKNIRGIWFFGKGEKVNGYMEELSISYSSRIEMVNSLTVMFNFKPTINNEEYTWKKNGKIISINSRYIFQYDNQILK